MKDAGAGGGLHALLLVSCYRGTGCAPKASSATKSAAAVAKAHPSAMEIIAKEMRFLDVVLNVQCPNGASPMGLLSPSVPVMDTLADARSGACSRSPRPKLLRVNFPGLPDGSRGRVEFVPNMNRWSC